MPQPDQEQNGNSDADRAKLIAGTSNPEQRRELEQLVAARNAAVAEVEARQAATFERDVASILRLRATAARNPGYRGPSWPVNREAVVQFVQVLNRAELENVAKPFNEKIDERLEPHREDIQRRMANASHGIDEERLQQSPTREPRSEREISQSSEPRSELAEQQRAEADHTEKGRTEEPVDWRRALNDPEYRREIQVREFRETANELTLSERERSQSSELLQAQSKLTEQQRAETAHVEEGRTEEPVDWRRALNDPEYRREIQVREFRETANEVTRDGGRNL